MNLDSLMQRADIWRAREASLHARPPATVTTGFTALDALLPGGGWPQGTLCEVLYEHSGAGELTLALPLLRRLSSAGRPLLWVNPPHLPYAPALAAAGLDLSRLAVLRAARATDALWAMDQALRGGGFGAMLGWSPAGDASGLRRLQLAAEAGDSLALLYRPAVAARQPSPASLRMRVAGCGASLELFILKRRGGGPTGPLRLSRDDALA